MRLKYRSRNTSRSAWIVGAAAGVTTMYMFDPQSGRRRRALVADQLNHFTHEGREFLSKARTDAGQRLQGLYRGSVGRLRREPPDERTLEQRIRSTLGRLSNHPHAIRVECTDGRVRLTGDVLEQELQDVVSGIERVSGVQEVVNELQVHSSTERHPTLQGAEGRGAAAQFEYLQRSWSPAPRVLAGATGLALLAAGPARRPLAAAVMRTLGAALLLRTVRNRPLTELFVGRVAAEGIVVQKSIHVYAEPDEVYAAWRDLEGLPRFMSHVREVTRTAERVYRWTVDGPGNVPLTWEAEITADVPGELVAWRTLPDAAVQSTGVVQFEPSSVGGTRIHVRMSYRPPANAVGHTIAKIFGRDPKRQIDDDLLRFKSFLESGTVSARHAPSQAVRH